MNSKNIGDNILRFRKVKNITQEQLSDMIGVTASAISKWENGNSTPDILILAPLARALGTTIDSLLSFEKELIDDEVVKIKQELIHSFLHENYEKGIEKSKKYLHEYPNNLYLKIAVASLIQMYSMLDAKSEEILSERLLYAIDLTNQVIKNNNSKYRNTALYLKAGMEMVSEDYDNCEKSLEEISKDYVEPSVIYIVLYEKQGKKEEAIRYCQSTLLRNLNESITSLSILSRLAKEEKNYSLAKQYIDSIDMVENTFNIGLASSGLHYYNLYMDTGEKELAAQSFHKYIEELLKWKYDYRDNLYFQNCTLELNEEGQKKIRKKYLKELFIKYQENELLEYDCFKEAIHKLKARVAKLDFLEN